MSAGAFVREARRRAGLTQRQLATRAGVSQPTIARIESGDARPPFERILEVVRAAGFDLDVHVVPLDEDALAMAERNLRRTPEERLDALVAAVELHEAGRDARKGDG
ncbi:MAG TPA: helix-turn-helix domain-containing protein [Actinomycetota bacterium]|nr:helix-turn-helix domain-containing protein [Actinomycetota bacterium]